MQTMNLEIVTPEGSIFSGDILSVSLPGSDGDLGIYPGHAALVTPLDCGVVDIQLKDGSHDLIAINWGYCEILEHKVTILAEGAIYAGDNIGSDIANSIQKARKLVDDIKSNGIAFAKTSKLSGNFDR